MDNEPFISINCIVNFFMTVYTSIYNLEYEVFILVILVNSSLKMITFKSSF